MKRLNILHLALYTCTCSNKVTILTYCTMCTHLECDGQASFESVGLSKVDGETGMEGGMDVHHLGSHVTQGEVTDHVIRLKRGV